CQHTYRTPPWTF
nr:immunoglobulin light chain junction region [Macaca mulatta]